MFELPHKVNIYENNQQPGTLWYHDHAMGMTSYNVRIGVHSFYPLRDKTVEANLPSGQFEKLLYLYGSVPFGKGTDTPTYVLDCTIECANPSSGACTACNSIKIPTVVPLPTLEKGSTYRFKLLNGDFAIEQTGVHFLQNTTTGSTLSYAKIPFTVIGADSTLRKTPVPNVEKVFLAPAERVEILIDFDTVTGDKVYLMADEADFTDAANFAPNKLTEFSLEDGATGGKKVAADLAVDQISLREIADDQIAVKRMRVLTWDFPVEEPGEFGINGHIRMHDGLSENPKLGTVEDWYFVNAMFFGHPMHVHLVQFQTLQYGSLRLHA